MEPSQDYVSLSLFLFLLGIGFFVIIHAARSCVHSMRMQTMCSYPLSGSIFFLSMCSSGCLRAFATFVFLSNSLSTSGDTFTITIYSAGVQCHDAFIPTLGSS